MNSNNPTTSRSKNSTLESTPTEKNKIKKYIIKGDVNVGKSNIIRRVLGHDFQELEATVGVEFGLIDVINVDPDDPNVILSIQIWDTCTIDILINLAGAERYRAITTSHIRNADGAFLVFDITSENSFDTLDFWNESIKKATNDDIVINLIGNKCDLTNRVVSRERAKQFASKYNLQGYSETSAKDNINIRETFISFYKNIYKKQKNNLEEKTKEMKKLLESKRQDPKLKCC